MDTKYGTRENILAMCLICFQQSKEAHSVASLRARV